MTNDKADATYHPDHELGPIVVERKVIEALCWSLGYDPNQVSRIDIDGRTVEVTRSHYIVDSRTATERAADRDAALTIRAE